MWNGGSTLQCFVSRPERYGPAITAFVARRTDRIAGVSGSNTKNGCNFVTLGKISEKMLEREVTPFYKLC